MKRLTILVLFLGLFLFPAILLGIMLGTGWVISLLTPLSLFYAILVPVSAFAVQLTANTHYPDVGLSEIAIKALFEAIVASTISLAMASLINLLPMLSFEQSLILTHLTILVMGYAMVILSDNEWDEESEDDPFDDDDDIEYIVIPDLPRRSDMNRSQRRATQRDTKKKKKPR